MPASGTTRPDLWIPTTVDQVDCEWMARALGEHHPGVRLRSSTLLNVIEGACLKLRVAVEYDAGSEHHALPRSFIVKGNFRRKGPELAFMFHDELRAYREIVGMTGVNTPKCFFAAERNDETMLVLEDLTATSCRFGSIEQPLSFAEAQSILTQLATLHAAFWDGASPPASTVACIAPSLDAAHMDYIRSRLQPDCWSYHCTLPRGYVVPRHLIGDPARLERALCEQHAFHRRGPQTVCHGDAHSANMYFNSKGAGLFDWALRRGPWHYDVSYFLVVSLDVADRRRWEGPLLQHYLGELALRGIRAPSFDQALYCHRREILFGCILFVANGADNWNETATCAAAFRFGMAAEDHQTLSAIENATAG